MTEQTPPRSDGPAVAGAVAVAPRLVSRRADPWAQTIAADDEQAAGYGRLITATRRMLAAVAAASPPGADARAAAAEVELIAAQLEAHGAGERKQLHGRIAMPGTGNTLLPVFSALRADDVSVSGTVVFDRHHMGAGWAAHGGTLPLLFDDVMGRLIGPTVNGGARTAYLHVDFRSVTRIGVEHRLDCRIDRREGRKVFVRAELFDGDTCTAEAEALFVVLRSGQP